MVYLLAVLMGYFIGTNSMVEKQAKALVGCGFSNPTMGMLSSLGGFGGWTCVLPAAYFVGSAWGNGFVEGFCFILAVFGGAFISGFFQVRGFDYLFSALTLFINIGLAIAVYSLT